MLAGSAALMALTCAATGSPLTSQPERPPNIVFILADDLGSAELGCYGQRHIRTPNIDRLAAEGFRFTRCYAGSPVCAPSRCVLMTGRHPGHAIVRDNREVQPEGQMPLPADAVTLAEVLHDAGYRTGLFGKWGLGPMGSSGDPLRQGFDRFYGYNCQRAAHNHYPTELWDDGKRTKLRNQPFGAHQRLPEGADAGATSAYERYAGRDYAPDLFNEKAREFVRENRDRPFFVMLTTTVPHLGLQVPADSLAEYAGAFPETAYTGAYGYVPHPTPRAAYAAMVSRMDREVGRMVDLVRELGIEDDTLFVFTSDNGGTTPDTGGADPAFFAANGSLRGHKGAMYEGGVRAPLIVRWKGRMGPGVVSSTVTGFEDWMPTLCDLAGIKDARGRKGDGVSIAPTLRGGRQPARRFLYREFAGYGGSQGVWMGRWKAVRTGLSRPSAAAPVTTELYDLDEDPAETRNVAAEHPAVLRRLEAVMRREHSPSREFPLVRLDGPAR